jgi:hypothetical protein
LGVLGPAQSYLFKIVGAVGLARVFPRPRKNGEENRREQSYYCYNDQKFNQSKATTAPYVTGETKHISSLRKPNLILAA